MDPGSAITDADLAAAVQDRACWRPDGTTAAVFAPPAVAAYVRVVLLREPIRRQRYAATIVRNHRAEHLRPFGSAADAVRWAERVRLTDNPTL